jgi:AraC-like DNA-binding protein
MVFVEAGGNFVQRRNGELLAARRGECLIVRSHPGDVVTIGSYSVRRLVAINLDRFEDVLVRHFHLAPPKSIEFPTMLRREHAPCLLLHDLVRHALASVAGVDGPFAASLSRQYADLILTALLLNVPNSFSQVLARVGGAAETRYVKRALEFMRASLDEPIDLDDIAGRAACSPRRLQMAFRVTYGITPMAMLRKMRLELAEKRLRAGECTNVTELAQSLGFGNPGRFAGEFRRQFGVLPSQILAVNDPGDRNRGRPFTT